MSRALNIAVADDEALMRDYYRDILTVLGHRVTCAAATGRKLVQCCRDARLDLVITDIKMPDMDGIEAACEICRDEPIPIILVSAFYDPELFERAKMGHVVAYLVKPIKQADLEAAIAIAMHRFEEFQALRKEAGELRQALEDRKLIERAKGVLMRRVGLGEEEAFRRLQKQSRDHNQKLVDVARMILRAEEAFQPPAR